MTIVLKNGFYIFLSGVNVIQDDEIYEFHNESHFILFDPETGTVKVTVNTEEIIYKFPKDVAQITEQYPIIKNEDARIGLEVILAAFGILKVGEKLPEHGHDLYLFKALTNKERDLLISCDFTLIEDLIDCYDDFLKCHVLRMIGFSVQRIDEIQIMAMLLSVDEALINKYKLEKVNKNLGNMGIPPIILN